MTRLTVHPETDAGITLFDSEHRDRIAPLLQQHGVRFDHPGARPPAGTEQGFDAGAVLAAHADLIAKQRAMYGYETVDAVAVSPDSPNLEGLRGRFLAEHTHAEDEARLMVDGAGVFYLRSQGEVLIVELTAGDLISVPQGMRHWFDMGVRPRFTAIRFFTHPDGWIGAFTGDTIAARFPGYAGAP
jgi:1,2-dihydroxy-3-keto-5-methylthiopentene dioxygenase